MNSATSSLLASFFSAAFGLSAALSSLAPASASLGSGALPAPTSVASFSGTTLLGPFFWVGDLSSGSPSPGGWGVESTSWIGLKYLTIAALVFSLADSSHMTRKKAIIAVTKSA